MLRDNLVSFNSKNFPLGSLVYVRYKDHILFRDVNPTQYQPCIRETIGWLDFEDEGHIRILWERFAMPDPPNESKPRSTGLIIIKKAIQELKQID